VDALLSGILLATWVGILPAGAVVLEEEPLPRTVHKARELALWMVSPQRSDCPTKEDWAPSCPGSTRGCFLRGAARVSLIDSVGRRLINTVRILDPSGVDSFDVPRELYSATPYHVGRHHKVKVLWLHDYNGDGAKSEFALFDAESCSDLFTALIGYSPRQDRLIWYPVHSRLAGSGETLAASWPETLFASKPTRLGHWHYVRGWPGDRAPQVCEADYLPSQESFEEVCHTEK
jgi:hypothetical protein